jgi:DNA-directed RNA polymerase subunit RPC12/RpoP
MEKMKKMCKEVKIEYKCDRCGKTIIEEKNPKFGFNLVGNYPKEFKRINKNYLCNDCQNEYQKMWTEFINTNNGKQKRVKQ